MDRPRQEDTVRHRGRARTARDLWWLVLTIAFALFVTTARVETYRGIEGRGSARIWDLWRQLAGELPDVGSSALVRASYVLMIVVFLLGILSALWLSLSMEDQGNEGDPAVDPRAASADGP